MKTVILAGGYGSRLSEETNLIPKPMVRIAGMPIIWHIMKIYSKFGLNDFVICLGYKGEVIKQFFLDYKNLVNDIEINFSDNSVHYISNNKEKWRIKLIDTGLDTMTGGRIKKIKKFIGKNETFCLTYGDGLSDVNISKLINKHKKSNKLATVMAVKKPGRFGSIKIKNNSVNFFGEKLDTQNMYVNAGFFVLDYNIFNYIKNSKTIWEREPLEKLTKEKELNAYIHKGFWKPMDTLKDKNELENILVNKKKKLF